MGPPQTLLTIVQDIINQNLKMSVIWAYVTAMYLPGLYFGTIVKINEGWLVKSMRNTSDNPELEIYKSILTIIMIIIPSTILITMSLMLTIKIYQINKLSNPQPHSTPDIPNTTTPSTLH